MTSLEFSPDYLRKLQQLNIRLRRAALGARSGIHKSLRKGHGLEFVDLRPYSPGDDFRAVDWNALARTDKIYTRLFREEQDLKVLIVEDHSLSLASFNIPKLIALSLCYISISSGDQVSLLLPTVGQFPWVRSASSFKQIVEFVKQSKASSDTDLCNSLMKAAKNLKVPARLFVISDFLFPLQELEKALEYSISKNFEVTIIIIDNLNNLPTDPDVIFVDSETKSEFAFDLNHPEARKKVDAHINGVIDLARYYNQQYVIVNADDDIETVIFKKFNEANILR